MNTTLKKGLTSDFAHLKGYDSEFLESLEFDDQQDESYLYRYLSCMFPERPLGPQDRPKHIPKIPVEEKMQAGLFALIARSVGRKEMLTHPDAIEAMKKKNGTDFVSELFGMKS